MARITFKAGDDYAMRLSSLAAKSGKVAEKALKAGAGVVADAIRANLEALPTDKYRRLREGEIFTGLSGEQKEDLLDAFGITPVEKDSSGWWNTKVGFDGYGRYPTNAYPRGVPNQLLARAAESGSSVRQKHPFVRPAVSASQKPALAAMQQAIDEECEKIMKG